MAQYSHPLINYILVSAETVIDDATRGLLLQLEKALFAGAPLIHYPSSGADMRDILYFNRERLDELPEDPAVFIHSDYYIDGYRLNHSFFSMLLPCFRHITSSSVLPLKAGEYATFQLIKMEAKGRREPLWILFFSGVRNEEVLSMLINNNIKVPYRYAVCDGITSGMFSVEESISTAFYFYFEELGTHHVITEYGRDKIRYRVSESEAMARTYGFNDTFLERQLSIIRSWAQVNLKEPAITRILKRLEIPYEKIMENYIEYPVNSPDTARFISALSSEPEYLRFIIRVDK